MRFPLLKSVVLVSCLLLPFWAPAALGQAASAGGNIGDVDAGQPIPNRYIIILNDSVPDAAAAANDMARQHGLQNTHVYSKALKGFVATVPPGRLNALSRDPRVKSIEQDQTVRAYADPWPTGIRRIFAPDNPDITIDDADTKRIDIDVAVIDSGIDATHPDLNVTGQQATCTSGSCIIGGAPDGNGHGTHVAGTIAAIDNGTGVVGVAPGARLWGVKVLDDSGSGSMSGVIAGVDWVTARGGQNGPIKVANMSLGGNSSSALCTAVNASVQQGVTYVVAAGNNNRDASRYSPANCSGAIAVSAIADYDGLAGGLGTSTCANHGADDTKAGFSNWSKTIPLIAAPGVCIRSTWKGGGYHTISGTSMASPHVAGAAALLAATTPGITPSQIREALTKNGNTGWVDTSPDGIQERLLDVGKNTVLNPATIVPNDDTASPTVLIVSPANGAPVSGKAVSIVIDASDTVTSQADLAVTWYVDSGTPQSATRGTNNFTASWDSTAVADGPHSIYAHAQDRDGNTRTVKISVTVGNNGSSPSPALSFGVQGDLGCQKTKQSLTFTVTMIDNLQAPVANAAVGATLKRDDGTGGIWHVSGTTDSTGKVGWRMIQPLTGTYTMDINSASIPNPPPYWNGLSPSGACSWP